METTLDILKQLEQKLESLTLKTVNKKVVTVFDGFLDSTHKAALQRIDHKVTHYQMAPILSNALGMFGIKSTCVGGQGCPDENGVSDLDAFNKYDWEYIKVSAGPDELKKMFLESDLLAFVDWANLPNAENIWEGVLNDIIKPSGRKDFLFFFDLCDPSKKSCYQIDEILDVISSFSYYGKVTLGLNQNEAMSIWSSLTGTTQIGDVKEAGRFIHYAMNIDTVMIHPMDRTIVFQNKNTIELPGRVVTEPKIQTGGGDNLNAGYILGLLAGFSIPESMILGMAASGFYVQEGKSATLTDLQEYLAVWRKQFEVQSLPERQKLLMA